MAAVRMGLWVALLLADAAWLTDNDAAIRGAPAVSLGAPGFRF